MQDKNILDSSTSFPQFSDSKHSMLCSELKKLYVAITRTRQRLWICENDDLIGKPMFDYWRKTSLVQTRKLDDDLARAMQVESTAEEWKSRGIKLLQEHNYEMATMCFERSGDSYWENLSKASGLKDSADRMSSSNPEMARTICREAAEIFEAIGEATSAAQCYILLNDFERAGNVYLNNFGETELEKAGECFSLAGNFKLAAEVYARGSYFSDCLQACSNGKLFDMGLEYVHHWKQHPPSHDKVDVDDRQGEMQEIEHSFLKSCALHYHKLDEKKVMMKFVKAFHSHELTRTFLKNVGCGFELMHFEEESGNFLEAAEISRQIGDFVHELELLAMAGQYKKASNLMLWHIFAKSLWCSGNNKGWPLKNFSGKDELVMKAHEIAKAESQCYADSVLGEARLCFEEHLTFSELKEAFDLHFLDGNERRCQMIAARRLLHLHLRYHNSKYSVVDQLMTDASTYIFSFNKPSPETLVSAWWMLRACTSEILHYLTQHENNQTEVLESDEYGEFCLNYLGVKQKKQFMDGEISYHLLYPDARWIRESSRGRVRSSSSFATAEDFISVSKGFWQTEMTSFGMKVLEKLKSLSDFNSIDSFSRTKSLLYTFNVFRSFEISFQENRRLQNIIDQTINDFFECIFPFDFSKSSTENIILLRATTDCGKMLEEYVNLRTSFRGRNKLSYGNMGRLLMAVLGSTAPTSAQLCRQIDSIFVGEDTTWRKLFQLLSPDNGQRHQVEDGSSSMGTAKYADFVLCLFQNVKDMYSNVNWTTEHDYISPEDFIFIIEGMLASLTAVKPFFFTTRSSFLEWFICPSWRNITTSITGSRITSEIEHVMDFVAYVVEDLLHSSQHMLKLWVNKKSNRKLNQNHCISLLVVRLITIAALLCLNYAKYNKLLSTLLWTGTVFSHYIPPEFFMVLRGCIGGGRFSAVDVSVVAKAFKLIHNPLVVVGTGSDQRKVEYRDTIFVHMGGEPCKEEVLRKLFPSMNGGSPFSCDGRGMREVFSAVEGDCCGEGNQQKNDIEKMWKVVEGFNSAVQSRRHFFSDFNEAAPMIKVYGLSIFANPTLPNKGAEFEYTT